MKKEDSSLNTMHIKKINRNMLFNFVYQNGPVSKQEIAKALDLSMPTTNLYLNYFEEKGLIIKDGYFKSTGGRKASAYICNSDYAYAIGVYMTQSFIIVTIINFLGEQIFTKKSNKQFNPTETYGKYIQRIIHEILAQNKLEHKNFVGIGYTIPGIIEKINDDIFVKFSPSLHYNQWSFDCISKFADYPFTVDNDANLGGFYESLNENSENSFSYLHIAGGVGGAIVLTGNQFLGNSIATAEFGHMVVSPHGKECHCGKLGCLETYIRRTVLSDDLNITLDYFFSELEKGNTQHQNIFNKYLAYLCIGISNIRLATGLEVVIAGELIEYLIPYEKLIEEKLTKLNPFESNKYFRFTKNKKENASSVAAALKVIANYLSGLEKEGLNESET